MARSRLIAGIEHVVYDSMEEFKASHPDGLVALEWQKGREGDWVLADDGTVMQILKYGLVSSKSPAKYIRTAAGTFILRPGTILDGRFRENVYSFGGHLPTSARPSIRERAFVAFVLLGCEPVKAYMEIFRTNNEIYARMKSYTLLGRTNIMNEIRESIGKAGGKTGATLEWAMGSIKDTVDGSKDERVKLKGADMIAEYHGAKSKDGSAGAGMGSTDGFQGFTELPEGETKQLAETPSPIPGDGPPEPTGVEIDAAPDAD